MHKLQNVKWEEIHNCRLTLHVKTCAAQIIGKKQEVQCDCYRINSLQNTDLQGFKDMKKKSIDFEEFLHGENVGPGKC
jgi:hypothetical protein